MYSGFDLNDEAALKNARLSKNRTLQQSLKEIGKKMNLPFNLTIHVARHITLSYSLKTRDLQRLSA